MSSTAYRELMEITAVTAIPGKFDIGPHANALIRELQQVGRLDLPLCVIILAAAIIDVLADERVNYGLADDKQKAGLRLAIWTIEERSELEWLRLRRNRILHNDGLIDGVIGTKEDKIIQAKEADRAIKAILPVLAEKERY